PAALLGEAHAHVERAPRHAVAVHGVLGLVGAVGNARLERLPDRVAALPLEERPRLQHGGGAEALEQFLDAPGAEPASRQHASEFVLQYVGEARVAEEDAEDLYFEHARAVDAHGGHDDALVEDLGGGGREAAGPQPADVPEVAPRLGERHEPSAMEDRRGE